MGGAGFHDLFSLECAAIDNEMTIVSLIVTAYAGTVVQVFHDSLIFGFVVFANLRNDPQPVFAVLLGRSADLRSSPRKLRRKM